ncbi:MAG: NAD(P)-binding protein [Phycisphaeraceae bacterium]|nr:MAG: NAD(P)-binding protein [Phycisphaeraceae bacterium]
MQSRRQVLKGGLGLFMLGSAGKALGGRGEPPRPVARAGDPQFIATRPLDSVAFDRSPRMIDGFPVRNWFEGDDFNNGLNIPFHSAQNVFPGGEPPEPQEVVDVCVVGGGLSGLCAAYLLRAYNPVVFELHERFGGNARGGVIEGAEFTLGSAYVITPDPGSFLDNIYRDLGLHEVVRIDDDPAPVEINGEINPDIWSGMGVPPHDRPAYERYRRLVMHMANVQYPDVPFDEPWMLELDQISFKQHIEDGVGRPIPAPLVAAIQAYCYSSFNGGWEELSAASGWNFLAAEEFGRWVFPGGNAWMADAFWQRLTTLDDTDPGHAPHLRAGRRVVDVRVRGDGFTQVTWRDRTDAAYSLLARRVVMCIPKHVSRYVVHEFEERDPAKYHAATFTTRAYAMANVILDRPVPLEFYDIFLLNDPTTFPTNAGEAAGFWRYTDVLDGSFAPGPRAAQYPDRPNVLCLYWPLPYDSGRFDLVLHDPIKTFGSALAPQLRATLKLVGVPESAVREIRFARWGHAMPLARVGFIASGAPQELIRPFEGSVYFVNQDNWALPAVENSFFDAVNAADAIAGDLG